MDSHSIVLLHMIPGRISVVMPGAYGKYIKMFADLQEALKETLTKLRNLLTWSAGWNGYDSLAPSSDAVLHAENWIVRLFLEVADLGLTWIQPNVIADANGDVVFEWWHGKKKLTVYIEDESAEYVQVWGTNIHSEMSNGDAEPISTCRSLWLWLVS